MLIPTLLLLTLSAEAAPSERFADFYYRYAQAIVAGDSLAARSAWWPDDLAFSERLRVDAKGPAPRIDGASPLVAELSRLRAHLLQLEVATLVERAEHAELELRVRSARDTIRHRVVGQWQNDRWWLRHPILVAISTWPVDELGELRQFREPSLSPDAFALKASAEFIAATSQGLDLSPTQRARLAEAQLGIVLAPDAIVAELAGVPTEGVANLQLDLILTSHPYHPHELAHLLVDLAYATPGHSVHPMLEEGLAVWLGGRSDATREDQLQLGALALREQLVDLERLLAPGQFGFEPSDFSYAASAVVIDTVDRCGGSAAVERSYRQLSAAAGELYALSPELVRERLVSASGQSSFAFAESLAARIAHWGRPVIHAPLAPTRPPDQSLKNGAVGAQFWWQGERLHARIELGSATAAGKLGWLDEARYELRASAGEVGLYDLALDKRLAKRVDAFAPDEQFWDAKRGLLNFAIDVARLPSGSRALRWIESSD